MRTTEEDPSEEALIAALNQDWNHARHNEAQRFWYTNVYSAILAGSLTFVDGSSLANILIVGVFLLFLTVTGIIITLKSGLVFHHYNAHTNLILQKLRLEEAVPNPLYRHKNESIRVPIYLSIGPWILGFYFISLSTIVLIEMYVFLSILIVNWIAFSLALITGAIIFISTTYVAFTYSKNKMKSIDDHVDSIDLTSSDANN